MIFTIIPLIFLITVLSQLYVELKYRLKVRSIETRATDAGFDIEKLEELHKQSEELRSSIVNGK